MLLADRLQNRLIHSSASRKRRVCFDDHIPLTQPIYQIRAPKPRMELILTNFDFTLSSTLDVLFQLLKMVKAIVGHADGSGFAGFLGFCQSTPGTQTAFSATKGCMEKVSTCVSMGKSGHTKDLFSSQVEVVGLCFLQTVLNRLLGCFVASCFRWNLCCKEDVGSLQPGPFEGRKTLPFVPIHRSRVDLKYC